MGVRRGKDLGLMERNPHLTPVRLIKSMEVTRRDMERLPGPEDRVTEQHTYYVLTY